jgi:hypothetical protein
LDISLEKIDVIRERTGLSYAEAREVLASVDGDLVEALVKLEERSKEGRTEGKRMANDVFDRVKDVITKGNQTKLRVSKEDKTLVEIPLTAGVLGTLIAPQLALVGAVAALATKCSIDLNETRKSGFTRGDNLEQTDSPSDADGFGTGIHS